MVKLYGVYHGYTSTPLFDSPMSFGLNPSADLLNDLQRLPKGAKIGIEWMPESDWRDIRANLMISAMNVKLSYSRTPHYERSTERYWNALREFCAENGYEVVFLEDKETFLKLDEASIRAAKAKKKIYRHENEDAAHYFFRLVSNNDREYRRGIELRKVHKIERDYKLLEAITNNGVEAAIVGKGHSDVWMHNQNSRKGVFDEYSVEAADPNSEYFRQQFIKNAEPDWGNVMERRGLERAIHLIETGKITDQNPDFAGTWDVHFPTQGYFELFIRKRNGNILRGTIEDLLGSAVFVGEITESDFIFKKIYANAVNDAARGEIEYKGSRFGDEIAGYFDAMDIAQAFYMVSAQKENPAKMSRRWHSLQRKDGKEPAAFKHQNSTIL